MTLTLRGACESIGLLRGLESLSTQEPLTYDNICGHYDEFSLSIHYETVLIEINSNHSFWMRLFTFQDNIEE